MPAVSVIVPVHNGEKYLEECLRSIAAQTLTDLEVIVVDDGSTDRTGEIIDAFAAADPRFRRLPGPATGSAGDARNVGLDHATGQYLSFLDADDFFAPSMLATLHAQAVLDDAQVVICKFRVFDERTGDAHPVSWPLRLEHLPETTPFAARDAADGLFLATNPAAWNKLFNTDYVRATGLRFQGLRRTNDAFFTYCALAHAERLSYIDDYLLSYRTGNTTSLRGSRDAQPLVWADALSAIREELRRTGVFEIFERGFTNLALDFCLANLRQPTSMQAYLVMHEALTSHLLAEFDILDREPSYFLRAELRDQLADLRSCSAQEFLFTRFQAASHQLSAARAEVRANLRELDALRSAPADAPTAQAAPAVARSGTAGTVSVILRAHDAETLVGPTLEALLTAEIGLEVIALVGAGNDLTQRVLTDRAAADPRIRVLPAAAGIGAALAAATGRWVTFAEAGDRWLPGALLELIERAEADSLDVLGFDAETLAAPDVDAKTWRAEQHRYRRSLPTGTTSGLGLLTTQHQGDRHRPVGWLYLFDRQFLVGLEEPVSASVYTDDVLVAHALVAAGRAAQTDRVALTHVVRPSAPLTSSSREAAARNYFLTCVRLSQLADSVSGPAATVLGDLVYAAFRQARVHFVRLNVDAGARIAAADRSATGRTMYLLLKQAHHEAQFKRRPTPASRLTAPGLPRRILRRVSREVKRLAPGRR